MTTVIPEYVIPLNNDYSIANYSISESICKNYNDLKNNTLFPIDFQTQYGGNIKDFDNPVIETQNQNQNINMNKYFTSNALNYINQNNLNQTEIIKYILDGGNNFVEMQTQTNLTNHNYIEDNFIAQSGGKLKKAISKANFLQNYTGEKGDKRLIYLMKIKSKLVVVKIMTPRNDYMKEKEIYKFFNKKAKTDKLVKTYILRSYDEDMYVKEDLYSRHPSITLKCNIDGTIYNIQISNSEIPPTDTGSLFITNDNPSNIFYQTHTEKGKYNQLKKNNSPCIYLVTQVKKNYHTYYDVILKMNESHKTAKSNKIDENKKIIKKIIYKTANILKYLNKKYNFCHWDLHAHNLLIHITKKGSIAITLFDFDWSTIKNNNFDQFINNYIKYYIRHKHNLIKSYEHMKLKEEDYPKNINKKYVEEFETYIYNIPKFHEFDLELHILNQPSSYFVHLGFIFDLTRHIISTKRVNKTLELQIQLENKKNSNWALEILFNIINTINANNFNRFLYIAILFTDYSLKFNK